ncbi:uncharacterized protein [Dermacentor andersoni]|uniref:uncharacterized protein isoform X2 n=1 Tax=Dermacentor andersoni TaxID=34620 RepID=UPI003B3B26A6
MYRCLPEKGPYAARFHTHKDIAGTTTRVAAMASALRLPDGWKTVIDDSVPVAAVPVKPLVVVDAACRRIFSSRHRRRRGKASKSPHETRSPDQ